MEDEKVESGKHQLILLLCLIIFIQVLFISIFYFRGGDDKMIERLIRFAIIGTLCLGTHRKSGFAKWFLIAYLIFNGLTGFYRIESINDYTLIVFSVTYLLVASFILFSKNIKLYLSNKPE